MLVVRLLVGLIVVAIIFFSYPLWKPLGMAATGYLKKEKFKSKTRTPRKQRRQTKDVRIRKRTDDDEPSE